MNDVSIFPKLLGWAVLLPLLSFTAIFLFGPRMGKAGKGAGVLATLAIASSSVLSFICLLVWINIHPLKDMIHGHADGARVPDAYAGEFYRLGEFGSLRLSISYYIDTLTICMFCMVTLIASLIHVYANGYMHDELTDITDKEVTVNGKPLRRRGRFPRFFQYLSLFCFSMLGLVLSGNVAMVFCFWELVGACSYFLIGFYIERKSASTAANKAFIVNRVGDFGMIIGLMVLWSYLGTFSFGDIDYGDGLQKGLFSQLRPYTENESGPLRLQLPSEIVLAGAPSSEYAGKSATEVSDLLSQWRKSGYGNYLLIIAGLGIFCGCVGKSAQFPLHVWLPDAMEGPTPVSALVHSATMVAAGVYLVGRFYPVFVPEVLLIIACIGCITLLLAASIAITATDIKRVLAYSTVSQLGYMMLALGVGGWVAGMLHLITHAFFKSLLFMCSGSVIHAVHTNDMRLMGGLRHKMPITACTMLVGCLAIAGVSVPFIVGFSGYYSKDAILEQAYSYMGVNRSFLGVAFFALPVFGAVVTAFYMFRMWFLTFAGVPRDQERYDHAHESPPSMHIPLIVLAVFATGVAWRFFDGLLGALLVCAAGFLVPVVRKVFGGSCCSGEKTARSYALPIAGLAMLAATLFVLRNDTRSLVNLLETSRPAGTEFSSSTLTGSYRWPAEHDSHAPAIVRIVTLTATGAGAFGIGLAALIYGLRWLNADELRKQFAPIYQLLVNRWWFDELYHWLFFRPAHVIGAVISRIDLRIIDWAIDSLVRLVRQFSVGWDYVADRTVVDGTVNTVARSTYRFADWLRGIQTGRLRDYVMFIVVGVVTMLMIVSMFYSST